MNKILRLEITDKCNLKCNMCWSTDWHHNDMTYEELEKIILDYKYHEPDGVVVLTSREPLLSPHFSKILKLCTELKLDVKILTNGTLLTEEICKIIMNNNVSFIGVSIHGDEKFHDSVTNVKGSYNKTIEKLMLFNFYKKLYSKNIQLRITTIVRKELFNNLDSILKLCNDLNASLRIQHMMWYPKSMKEKHMKIINKKYNYNDDIIFGFPDATNITPEQVNDLITIVRKKAKEMQLDFQIYPELNLDEINKHYSLTMDKYYGYCDHPSESIRVRANGDVTFCQYIDKCFGNLKSSSLSEIIYLNKEYANMCNDFFNGELLPVCCRCCHYMNGKQLKKESNHKI